MRRVMLRGALALVCCGAAVDEVARANTIVCPKGTAVQREDSAFGVEESCQKSDNEGNKTKHGPSIVFDATGRKIMERNYADGQLEGRVTVWFPNGQKRSETEFKAGLEEGVSREWYLSGELHTEAYYQSGELHGQWKYWFQDGGRAIEEYKNGKPDGKWVEFNGKGQVVQEQLYSEGQLVTQGEKPVEKSVDKAGSLPGKEAVPLPTEFLPGRTMFTQRIEGMRPE